MGAIFEKYGGMIVGIIAVVLLIAVVLVIGDQFKTNSGTQYNNLETVISTEMKAAGMPTPVPH